MLPVVSIVVTAEDTFAGGYPQRILRANGQIVNIADEVRQASGIPMRAIIERNRHPGMAGGSHQIPMHSD